MARITFESKSDSIRASSLDHLTVWVVGVLAALLLLFRQFLADTRMLSSIWAEDGWIPMCVLDIGHVSCLTQPVNGYWPIIHRVAAEPLSMLPLAWWPLIFPLLGSVSIGFMCGVVFKVVGNRTTNFIGLLCGLGVVLIPVLGVEFLNVFGNIHWLLLMAALVVIALGKEDNVSAPITRTFFFIAALSNPAGFVIPGVLLLLVIARLTKIRTVVWPFAISLVGWGVQLIAILRFEGIGRVGSSLSVAEKTASWANAIVGIVPGLRIVRESPASHLFAPTFMTPALVVFMTLGFLTFVILGSNSNESQKRFSVLGMGTQALTAFLLLILDENPRYTFVLVALNLIWIIGLLGASVNLGLTTKTLLVVLFLFAPLAGFKAGSYRATPSSLTWQDQLDKAERICALGEETAEFFFAPDRTYAIEVSCSSL